MTGPHAPRPRILYVPSDINDSLLPREALHERHPSVRLRVCINAEIALQYLRVMEQAHDMTPPIGIVIDDHLPMVAGSALIRFIRDSMAYRSIPVILLMHPLAPTHLAQTNQIPDDQSRLIPTSWDGWCSLWESLIVTMTMPRFHLSHAGPIGPGRGPHARHDSSGDPRHATTIILPPADSASKPSPG